MGLFDKLKKKPSIFIYDDQYDEFYAELNGIRFVCESFDEHYEQLAEELSNAYGSKLADIVAFILPAINEMFGETEAGALQEALGKPQIDLDRSIIDYCEQTLDDTHIISVEFGGLFTAFYDVSIDG